jgi:NAD(P)-dependent dehydrogenase (short-subunit alcohol dehydrogenase family)
MMKDATTQVASRQNANATLLRREVIFRGARTRALATASKATAASIATTVAVEMKPSRVTCNAIYPKAIRTSSQYRRPANFVLTAF